MHSGVVFLSNHEIIKRKRNFKFQVEATNAVRFFSCNDPKNINEGTPHFAMDERIHNYIFSGRDFKKYKVLPKFKDYYSDSVISLSETSALIDEICDVKDYDGVNKEAIDEFILFVVNAIQYRHSIYIYSD